MKNSDVVQKRASVDELFEDGERLLLRKFPFGLQNLFEVALVAELQENVDVVGRFGEVDELNDIEVV